MGSAKRALSVSRDHRGEHELHTIIRLLHSMPLYKFFVQIPFISIHQLSEVICYKMVNTLMNFYLQQEIQTNI